MKVHLLCKGCERPITKVLTPFCDAGSDVKYYYLKHRWRARKKTVDPRDVLLTFEDGLPLVPEGTAYDASDNLAIFNPLPGLFDVCKAGLTQPIFCPTLAETKYGIKAWAVAAQRLLTQHLIEFANAEWPSDSK